VELDETLGSSSTQVRVVQDKEPAQFLAIFKGKYIVHAVCHILKNKIKNKIQINLKKAEMEMKGGGEGQNLPQIIALKLLSSMV
jgi:hypothetical protein